MLHFLLITALCIFIGERLWRWLSPRVMLLMMGSVVLGAVVVGGSYLILTETPIRHGAIAPMVTATPPDDGPDYNENGTLTIKGLNRLLPPAPKPSH